MSDVAAESKSDDGDLENLHITSDSQIITMCKTSGYITAFLIQTPMVFATFRSGVNTKVAFLSSLKEVTIIDVTEFIKHKSAACKSMKGYPKLRIAVSIEPHQLAINQTHLVCCIDNKAYFYAIPRPGSVTGGENLTMKEHFCKIDDLKVNAHLFHCALCGNKIYYEKDYTEHFGKQKYSEEKEAVITNFKTLPANGRTHHFEPVTCMTLTKHYLIYATSKGKLYYFSVDAECMLHKLEVSHHTAPSSIESNELATWLLVNDDDNNCFLINPMRQIHIKVHGTETGRPKVLWDIDDQFVFTICGRFQLSTYVFEPRTLSGPKVTKVSLQALSHTMSFF